MYLQHIILEIHNLYIMLYGEECEEHLNEKTVTELHAMRADLVTQLEEDRLMSLYEGD